MINDKTTIRVRYSETDKMGYVYYGNYLTYYEVGRTEMIRKYGLSYEKMEQSGIMLPVVSASCNFKAPAYYDELLTINTIIKERPGTRINFDYEIFNSEEKLINTGKTTLVFIDSKTRKPCRPPKDFSSQTDPFFN